MTLIAVGLILPMKLKGQNTDLDTCKREYIALSRTYQDLKDDYTDVVYSFQKSRELQEVIYKKEVKKARRKARVRGFLWGGVVGCLAMAWALR